LTKWRSPTLLLGAGEGAEGEEEEAEEGEGVEGNDFESVKYDLMSKLSLITLSSNSSY
jgi:hypothetical protein